MRAAVLNPRVVSGLVVAALWPALATAQGARRVAVMLPEGDAPPEVAERIVRALAEAGQAAGLEVVRPAVPLEEVRLTVECPEPSPACTAVVGRNLGVDEVVLVRVTREGQGWRVESTRFDVSTARAARHVETPLSAGLTEPDLRRLGEGMFAAGVQEAPPPVATRRWGRVRPRTWITGAAGGALLVLGGVFGGLSKSAQNDLDASALPTPGDRAATRRFVDLADRGQAYATTANVFFAIGGATLVAAGVLLYLDLRTVEVQPTRDGLTLSFGGTF